MTEDTTEVQYLDCTDIICESINWKEQATDYVQQREFLAVFWCQFINTELTD